MAIMTRRKFGFFYPSVNGSLQGLTSESQEGLICSQLSLQICDLWKIRDVIDKLPIDLSLRKYMNCHNKTLLLSCLSTSQVPVSGSNDMNSVNIFINGKEKVDNQKYLEISKKLSPDILLSLTEVYSSDESSGFKSLKRNIKKTQKFSEETIAFISKMNMDCSFLPIWQGSLNKSLREEHLCQIIALGRGINGIAIAGLFDKKPLFDKSNKLLSGDNFKNEENDKENKFNIRRELLKMAASKMSSEDLIYVFSDGNPLKIIECALSGATLFEAGFPFELTKKGLAWNFNREDLETSINNIISANYEINQNHITNILSTNSERNLITIDLNDGMFTKSLNPVNSQCSCYSCTNFSSSYINHLLGQHEMTALVLLAIHNCHSYQCFFDFLNTDLFKERPFESVFSFLNLYSE